MAAVASTYKPEYVYVADDGSGCCKVGCACDPEDRVSQLRTGNIHLKLVYYRQLPKLYEKVMHTELTKRGLHYDREWFCCSADTIITLLDEIDTLHPLDTLPSATTKNNYPRTIPANRPPLDWVRLKDML